jgi:hypothetical protein
MLMKVAQVAFLGLLLPHVCRGQSAREIAKTAFKSVVLLETNDSDGTPLGLGTGFFVSDGVIATNAHVIEGAYSGTAKIIGNPLKMRITGTIGIDRHYDLALIKVDGTAPPLHFGPDAGPAVGDKVYAVGNPLGLEGTFSEGIISGVRAVGTDTILQMTAPISPGSSGGPVMDSGGAVIGIAEATFTEGQNLNLAVPCVYLSKLLASSVTQVRVTPLGEQGDHGGMDRSIVHGINAGGMPKPSLPDIERQAEGLYAGGSYADAAALFEEGCTGGEKESCRNLGAMYQQGQGVAQDYSTALILYSKSCKAGDAAGCDLLGGMYQEGLGVDRDYFRAFPLYSKACDSGYASSCNNLGTLFYDGDGTVQDRSHAVALYSKACQDGSATGCKNLAGCYRDGIGVHKDKAKAKEYFSKSCMLGNQYGCDAMKSKR